MKLCDLSDRKKYRKLKRYLKSREVKKPSTPPPRDEDILICRPGGVRGIK